MASFTNQPPVGGEMACFTNQSPPSLWEGPGEG